MADRIMPCPHCGKNYNISTFDPGMKFKCTGCGNVVTVPGAKSRHREEPERETRRPSRRDRGSRRSAPPPPRSRGRRDRPSRRDDFDEDNYDRRNPPRKKDNTALYAILGAVGFIVILAIVMATIKTDVTNPTTPPPDETPSGFSGSYGTPIAANYSKNPIKPTDVRTPYVSNGVTITPPQVKKTAKPDKKTTSQVTYMELSECTQDLQDYVKNAIKLYGGEDALKFNSSKLMKVIFKGNMNRDKNVPEDDPMAPFSWIAETELSATMGWKRAGSVNKLFTSMVQASLEMTTCWNGKKLRKFIGKNETDGDEETKNNFRNEAYNMDIMYKISNGQYTFLKDLRTKKRLKFDRTRITVDYFKMKDKLDGKQIQICFYNDDNYADWRGLPAMIIYKDKASRTQVHQYYWNYAEKNGLKFPHDTITFTEYMDEEMKNVDTSSSAGMKWMHINHVGDEELGEINFGENVVADYLFEKPAD